MAEGDPIRIIPHRGVDDDSGSFEVWFADGRKSVRFYWDNVVSRRLSPNTPTREQAIEKAAALARAEMDKLDNPGHERAESNRAPADELADLREKIRELEAREEFLRQGFIDGSFDPQGVEFVVTVETKINERFDHRAMRGQVNESVWKPFLIQKEGVYVKVTRRSGASGNNDRS